MKSAASIFIFLQIVVRSLSDTSTLPTPDATDKDVCTGIQEIPADDRIVSDTSVPGARCDEGLSTGWYRFSIGGVATTVPTTCIKPQACGSEIALRIDLGGADLPGAGEETEAWSCGAYNVLGKYDCCVLRKPVRIRNCTNFLAYYIHKPDRCSVSYCVQDIHQPVPPNAMVKTGEDVNPIAATMSVTDTSTTSTAQTTIDSLGHHCIEGAVWCARLPVPRCTSLEECEALPYTTESVHTDITTEFPVEVNVTEGIGEPTTPSTVSGTDTPTNASATTESVEVTSLVSAGSSSSNPEVEFIATTTASTTTATTATTIVTRGLFSLTSKIEGDTTTRTVTPQAEPTPAINDSTTHVHAEESSELSGNNTTDNNTTSESTFVDTSSSSGQTTAGSSQPSASIPSTPEVIPTVSPEGTSSSPSNTTIVGTSSIPNKTTIVSTTVSSERHMRTTSDVVDQHTTSQFSTSMSETTSQSSSTSAMSSTRLLSTLHVPRTTSGPHNTVGPPLTTTTPPATHIISSTVTMATHHTTPVGKVSTTTTTSVVKEWVVIEFTRVKADIDYKSNVQSSLPVILNTYYKEVKQLSHTFTSTDITVIDTIPSTTTEAVIIEVTFEESGRKVTVNVEELLQMFRILESGNKLNEEQFVDKMGTSIVDYYKYGDRLLTTVPPVLDGNYSLFYDKLPLFIAIIVMASVCLLVCLFGLVYLRYFRYQRTWDTQKDMERANLKDNRVHEGLSNPVPDSEMMKDEQTVTETPLTVNGSHPPPSITADDEKGWVVPIDQAPESLLQVALRTEDTKL